MTSKERKQLGKAYIKVFKHLQKGIFTDKKSGLLLFVEYLKYLRDFSILTNSAEATDDEKMCIATIITAISEFEAYTQTENAKQRVFHWNNFCELLKQNMEDWLKINDSI